MYFNAPLSHQTTPICLVILSEAKDQCETILMSPKLVCRRMILRFAQDDIQTLTRSSTYVILITLQSLAWCSWGMARHAATVCYLPPAPTRLVIAVVTAGRELRVASRMG